MERRKFIRNTALVSLALPTVFLNSCERSKPSDTSSSKGEETVRDPFELKEVSIDELQAKMINGELTSRALVEMYLKRIEQIDRNGFSLQSIMEINPDALAIADKRDEERKGGQIRSQLHGIPFVVKDNIDTGDKMMTTAGSLALNGNYASQDAPIVKRLREAGAVLIGKANLSEWANFRSSRSSSGWSSRGGQTKNPYSLDRNPCGSSSGSGVAVAANLCSFAIGTETNGSINCPSAINGIVGLKPTVGLVSRTGIIPISKTQDTAGPMTRTVREAAIVLNAISAADEQDEATLKRPSDIPSDYTSFLNPGALQGKRIGIEKSFLKGHERVDVLLQQALDQMRSKGATIVEVEFVKKLKGIGEDEYKLLQFEFKDGLNRYLSGATVPVKSLKDLIDFNKKNADKMMPFFGQEIFEASEACGDLNSDEYKKVRETVVSTARKAIDGLMKEYDLHSLCGPAAGPAWTTDVVNGDSFSGYGMGSGAAMAGYPSITVPLGEVHGLPVGLLFIGTAFGEGELLALAFAYEQASANRKPPTFQDRVL